MKKHEMQRMLSDAFSLVPDWAPLPLPRRAWGMMAVLDRSESAHTYWLVVSGINVKTGVCTMNFFEITEDEKRAADCIACDADFMIPGIVFSRNADETKMFMKVWHNRQHPEITLHKFTPDMTTEQMMAQPEVWRHTMAEVTDTLEHFVQTPLPVGGTVMPFAGRMSHRLLPRPFVKTEKLPAPEDLDF